MSRSPTSPRLSLNESHKVEVYCVVFQSALWTSVVLTFEGRHKTEGPGLSGQGVLASLLVSISLDCRVLTWTAGFDLCVYMAVRCVTLVLYMSVGPLQDG